MSITHEGLDKLEKDLKESLEETKTQLIKLADRQRLLLARISAMRGGLVMETNEVDT